MFTSIVIRMYINNNNKIFILVIQDVWTDGVDHSSICGLLNFWWSSQNRIVILMQLKRSQSSPNFVFVSVFAWFDRDFQERSTASFWLRRDFSLREPEKARCLNSSLWSRSQSYILDFLFSDSMTFGELTDISDQNIMFIVHNLSFRFKDPLQPQVCSSLLVSACSTSHQGSVPVLDYGGGGGTGSDEDDVLFVFVVDEDVGWQ